MEQKTNEFVEAQCTWQKEQEQVRYSLNDLLSTDYSDYPEAPERGSGKKMIRFDDSAFLFDNEKRRIIWIYKAYLNRKETLTSFDYNEIANAEIASSDEMIIKKPFGKLLGYFFLWLIVGLVAGLIIGAIARLNSDGLVVLASALGSLFSILGVISCPYYTQNGKVSGQKDIEIRIFLRDICMPLVVIPIGYDYNIDSSTYTKDLKKSEDVIYTLNVIINNNNK